MQRKGATYPVILFAEDRPEHCIRYLKTVPWSSTKLTLKFWENLNVDLTFRNSETKQSTACNKYDYKEILS